MKDNYNRNINYARISITDYCNLYCQYCRSHDDEADYHQMCLSQLKHLLDALDQLEFSKIRFTGGEPLLCKDIVEMISYTNQKKHVNDIGLTTNGILLDQYAKQLISVGLKRINVSLDSLDAKKYESITGFNQLDSVLQNIELCQKLGLKIKINVVLLKGINDDEIKAFLDFGRQKKIQVRFIELMPIGDNLTYYETKNQKILAYFEGLEISSIDKECGDVTSYFQYQNDYEFGIISPMSDHFCAHCNRIRFTSNGHLRLCLHSDIEYDLNPYLDDTQKLVTTIEQLIYNKPEKHELADNKVAKKSMSKIGG